MVRGINMRAIMAGKFMKIFLAVIFLTGIISVALCLTGNFSGASACCHNKMQGVAKNNENCLSDCAKQKVSALKTEVYSQERPEIQALFNEKDTIISLKNLMPKTFTPSRFYPNEAIPILLPNQTYLASHFTLAPPIAQ
jgi:hypothetical protein